MATLNISLPEPMREFIERQIAGGSYGTASEYLRDLVRKAQKEQSREQLETKMVEGLESGPVIPGGKHYFENKKRELQRRLRQKSRR